MTQVRLAEARDIAELLVLGRALHSESDRYRGIPFSDDRAGATLGMLQRNGWLFVAEHHGELVGFLAMMVFPHMFSDTLMASDVSLYVSPAHRGGMLGARLVRQFEHTAAAAGAREGILGISTGIHQDKTAALYERLGYERCSVALRKEMGNV